MVATRDTKHYSSTHWGYSKMVLPPSQLQFSNLVTLSWLTLRAVTMGTILATTLLLPLTGLPRIGFFTALVGISTLIPMILSMIASALGNQLVYLLKSGLQTPPVLVDSNPFISCTRKPSCQAESLVQQKQLGVSISFLQSSTCTIASTIFHGLMKRRK